MATPREITQEEYERLYAKLLHKASKSAKSALREPEDWSYWFSVAFEPCSGEVRTTDWKYGTPRSGTHFTSIPCDEYCFEKLPVATCLIHAHDDKYYTCCHKVGNCPWKR
jgi:hypothetical protein